jgi:hypothetical protein
MKFPAAAIAICFTSGIAMGRWPRTVHLPGDFISANWLRRFS